MSAYLMKIIFNQQGEGPSDHRVKEIVSFLHDQGFSGVVAYRGIAGIDGEGRINRQLLEDAYYDDLPVIIEAVRDERPSEEMQKELIEMNPHSQITFVPPDSIPAFTPTHWVVKIYTSEQRAGLINREEHERILLYLRDQKVMWAVVTKGLMGFGADGEVHGQHLFTVGSHMPLIIECVVPYESLEFLVSGLKDLLPEGIVFTAPVQVLIHH